MKKIHLQLLAIALLIFTSCQSQTNQKQLMDNKFKSNPHYSKNDSSKVTISEDEWKKILSPEIYQVSRQKGTERPWSSKFEDFKEIGTYYCGACGNALFKSDTKFDAGCGWPSFYEPISKTSVIYETDNTLGMKRTEVMCGRCKGHLGHVFDDGPPPTGLRYCINGVVLDFEKAKEAEKNYNKENPKKG
jgi:peptide-methionine (R)-S-oxide reductase